MDNLKIRSAFAKGIPFAGIWCIIQEKRIETAPLPARSAFETDRFGARNMRQTRETHKKKKRGGMLWALLAMVLVWALLMAGAALLLVRKIPEPGGTAGGRSERLHLQRMHQPVQ